MKVNSSPKRAGTRKIQDFAKNAAGPSSPAAAASASVSSTPAPVAATPPAAPSAACQAGLTCQPTHAPVVG